MSEADSGKFFIMGAGKSTPEVVTSSPKGGKVNTKATGEHTPFPEDVQPYEGPQLDYLMVTVPVQKSFHFSTGITAGHTTRTSNIDAYYPTIAGYLQQGYTLNAFYRVPGTMSLNVYYALGRKFPFEAVYSKPVGAIPNPEGTRLLVEKSTMHLQRLPGGILSTTKPIGTVANTSFSNNFTRRDNKVMSSCIRSIGYKSKTKIMYNSILQLVNNHAIYHL